MMAALGGIAVGAGVYFICGFAWQGFIGRPAHMLIMGGKPWNWIASEPFFFRGLQFDGSAAPLAAWLQILCVGLAALIHVGCGADCWRFGAICLSTGLWAVVVYTLFAH